MIQDGLIDTVPGKDWLRPSPIPADASLTVIDRKSDPDWVVDALRGGERLLIGDLYSTGLTLMAALSSALKEQGGPPDKDSARDFRQAFQAAANRLLVPVKANALAVRKAPDIPWLEQFYPEVRNFLLPFPQVQGMNGSWQWYSKGMHYPMLGGKLFPFYGVYFPTRLDHLELLDRWLRERAGAFSSAVDVGVGCGVLAFQTLRHGVRRVTATDVNPNAIESIRRENERRGTSDRVRPVLADLFDDSGDQADLIVFNPPWLCGDVHTPLDQAVYYDDDLLERFFQQAAKRLSPKGRVVLLFSNLGGLMRDRAEDGHPVERELAEGGRFERVAKLEQSVKPPSNKSKRRWARQTRRSERVELWELAGRDATNV